MKPNGNGQELNRWGLLGHDWAVEMLMQQVANRNVRSAYLFTGSPGVGRRTMALRFAQAISCLQPPAPGESCGKCLPCRQIEAMKYPDLSVISTLQEGSVLKVGGIRPLIQSLWLKPMVGKHRFALLLRLQEANLSSSNALLKILEEPPPSVILFLTANSPESLPTTIVSRCEVLRLRPVPVEAVETWLLARQVEKALAHLAAHISGGCPGTALRLLQDNRFLEFRKQRLDELQTLLQASRRECFAYVEKLTKRERKPDPGENRLRDTLLVWLSFWRDVLLCATGSSAPLVNVDVAAAVQSLADRLSLQQVQRLVNDASLAVERLEHNINSRLLVEVLLLDWPRTP